jgi:hypothetical protein
MTIYKMENQSQPEKACQSAIRKLFRLKGRLNKAPNRNTNLRMVMGEYFFETFLIRIK